MLPNDNGVAIKPFQSTNRIIRMNEYFVANCMKIFSFLRPNTKTAIGSRLGYNYRGKINTIFSQM